MSRFATFDSLKKKESDQDESDGNEYYTGGMDARTGGGSGMAVQGRPEDRNGGADYARRMVEQARATSGAPPGVPPESMRRITLYKNGFKVDDGEFRDLSVEDNRKFVDAINEGFVPPELAKGAVKGQVHVGLDDRREEVYVPPPPPAYVAFGGPAATLGGASVAAESAVFQAALADAAAPAPVSEPSTTVQVKMHDGKKLRVKISTSATLLQLLGAIKANGGVFPPSFSLSHGFPPQAVDASRSGTASVAELGLAGASITVKAV